MIIMSNFSDNHVSANTFQGGFYENAVLVMKKQIVEYGTILNLVITIDLSSISLSGEIPEEVTSLLNLLSLNLSHNHSLEESLRASVP